MKKTQLLKKAIGMAIKNGYKLPRGVEPILNNRYQILFSHNFAKAFWGKSKVEVQECRKKSIYKIPHWAFHLKLMVLEEEPLRYIEEWLTPIENFPRRK